MYDELLVATDDSEPAISVVEGPPPGLVLVARRSPGGVPQPSVDDPGVVVWRAR